MPATYILDTSADTINLTLYSGKSFPAIPLSVKDESGNFYSFAGAKINWQFKTRTVDTVSQKTITENDFTLDSTNTIATVGPLVIVDLPVGSYVSDISVLFNGQTLPITIFNVPTIVNQYISR